MAFKSAVLREKTIIYHITTKHNSNQIKYCIDKIVIAVVIKGKCHLRKEDVSDSEKIGNVV